MNTTFQRKRHKSRDGTIGRARPWTESNSIRVQGNSSPKRGSVHRNNDRRCGKPVLAASPLELAFSLAKLAEAPSIAVSGILELLPAGYGFLRDLANNYKPAASDALIPAPLVQQCGLRPGVAVRGLAQQLRDGESPLVYELFEVGGSPKDEYHQTKHIGSLTPIHPQNLLRLETGPQRLSTRIIDLFVPIGKGQRALIVAPPRTGKTVLLKEIGQAVKENHPEVNLVMLLVEEFKGTGNWDLVLDRRLAERRIWPAIDLTKSGTRREEKLLDARTLQAVTCRRRIWNLRDPAETMHDLAAQMGRHSSHPEFVDFISRQAAKAVAA